MAEQTKHWAADEAARKHLAGFGNQHGLDSTGIMEILGIKKLSDHKGTKAEAIAAIAQWAKDQAPPEPTMLPDKDYAEAIGADYNAPPEPEPVSYQIPTLEVNDEDQAAYFEACAQLPETPVVTTTVFQDAQGYEWFYTIHAGLPAHQGAIAHQLTAVEIDAFHQEAGRYGWTPLIDPRRVGGNGAQKPAPALALVPPSGNGNTQTFRPQSLEYAGKSKSDSLYWRCVGHPFNEYGVIIWEETLPDELKDKAKTDLSQHLDITGWLATYSQQPSRDDPNRLVPDKVVNLTKAA